MSNYHIIDPMIDRAVTFNDESIIRGKRTKPSKPLCRVRSLTKRELAQLQKQYKGKL